LVKGLVVLVLILDLVLLVVDDLQDLDEAEGGSQPAQGRRLVGVDLGHRLDDRLSPRRLVAAGAQMQVDPAALKLELVDLALAVVLAPSLECEDLQVAGQMLELSQQVSYRHATRRSLPSADVVWSWAALGSIGPAWTAQGRARCAVGGAKPDPRRIGSDPRRAGGRHHREPQQRVDGTSLQACWQAVTLSNENDLSRFWAYRDPRPPPSGPQRAAHGPPR
jgi:hypothetical protein